MLQLRRRPALTGLGAFTDQFVDADAQRLGDYRQGRDLDTPPADFVGGDSLLLVEGGVQKIARISKERAVEFRRAGGQELNVMTNRRQLSSQIEHAANPHGARRDVAHELKDGSGTKGLPHYQTDGVRGHTFWGKVSVAAASLATGLNQVAEAAEYIPDATPRPATSDDISRTNRVIDAINGATGLGLPKFNNEQELDGFQGVFRVEGRIDSQRLDKELNK